MHLSFFKNASKVQQKCSITTQLSAWEVFDNQTSAWEVLDTQGIQWFDWRFYIIRFKIISGRFFDFVNYIEIWWFDLSFDFLNIHENQISYHWKSCFQKAKKTNLINSMKTSKRA
jgi:hypothetical protein